MKLTEQQLQNLFQNSTANHQTEVLAGDCLAASDASESRLQNAEALINDHTAAQALKIGLASKPWAQQVAKSIENQSVNSWFNWISNPFKPPLTATAMALALFAIVPQVNHTELQMTPLQTEADVIKVIPFESDVLSTNSFDSQPDNLFGASFG